MFTEITQALPRINNILYNEDVAVLEVIAAPLDELDGIGGRAVVVTGELYELEADRDVFLWRCLLGARDGARKVSEKEDAAPEDTEQNEFLVLVISEYLCSEFGDAALKLGFRDEDRFRTWFHG